MPRFRFPNAVRVAILVPVLALAVPAGSAPAQSVCTATKARCVAKTVQAVLKCHEKAERAGRPVDAACLAKAEAKFDGPPGAPEAGCFAVLEAKQNPANPATLCITVGDAELVAGKIDAFVLDIVSGLDPSFPTPTPTPTVVPACGDATAPSCLGSCPPGETCFDQAGTCGCGAFPCGVEVGPPECWGVCPAGTSCQEVDDTTCACLP